MKKGQALLFHFLSFILPAENQTTNLLYYQFDHCPICLLAHEALSTLCAAKTTAANGMTEDESHDSRTEREH